MKSAFSRSAGSTSGIFDVGSKLGNKGFQRLQPNSSNITVSAGSGADAFYKRIFGPVDVDGADDVKVGDDVSVFCWDTANEQQETVARWNAFMTHKDQQFFIEAPSMLTPPSKESLVSLLELAEDLGCRNAYVCIEKNNPKLSELIRVFLYLGFQMLDPMAAQKAVKRVPKDLLLLGYSLE